MLKFAFEGFFRYRKQRRNLTLVLITSFSLLLFFLSLFSQISGNIKSYWQDNIVGGNIILPIESEFYDFFSPLPLELAFNYPDFVSEYQRGGEIFTPRIRAGALFEHTQEVPLIATGIDPETESRFGNHLDILEGRLCEAGQKEVVLALGTARTIGVDLNEQLVFTVMTHDGYPSYELLTVTGFISFGNVGQIIGENIAYMPIDVLRELTMLPEDSATEVLTVSSLKQRFWGDGNFRFIEGDNIIPYSQMMSLAIRAVSILLLIILGVFLSQSISHNIVIMLEDRAREIGVYLTYGATPGWVIKLIGMELIIYAFYCVLIGGVVGIGLILGFNALGLYSIDIATEILMSSSHFVISVLVRNILISTGIILLLILGGAAGPIIRFTTKRTIRELNNV